MSISKIKTNSLTDASVSAVKLGTVFAANITGLGAIATLSNVPTANVTGLGTIATQASNSVSITGGNVFGVGLRVEAAVASANVLTLNYANATVFTHTATTNLAILPTNIPAQQGILLLKLTNGGAVTVSYTGNAGFVANTAPTLTAAGTDFLFIQGNTTHYSVFTQLDVR